MYQAPRGTKDILPQEQAYWRYVEAKASAICQLCGYERIDTPAFEDAGLFTRSVGQGTDIVDKEMYTFQDRGGGKMALTPEGTAPVCRAYIEHGLSNKPQPVRLYYLTSIFRYGRPQAGRYRQHYQFGLEAIGDADPALDAEIIDMARQFYLSLGLEGFSLHLNSIGCKICRPAYLDSLTSYYADRTSHLCPDCRRRLERNPLRLLDCKRPSCQEVAEAAPRSIDHLCSGCERHWQRLKAYLALLDLPHEVNHRLVRGLDYYTRTVFEVQIGEGAQSALGGGGRYEDLIEELGGKPTPAIGFAAGMERIILNLKKQGVPVPALSQPEVFVAYAGDKAKEAAIKLMAGLRQAEMATIAALGDKSLKAQLRQANALGVGRVVIVGEEEAARDTVVLRDMASGQQREVPSRSLVAELKSVSL